MPALKQPLPMRHVSLPHRTQRAALALAGRTLDGLNTKYEAQQGENGAWYAVALLRTDQEWMRLSLLERGLIVHVPCTRQGCNVAKRSTGGHMCGQCGEDV